MSRFFILPTVSFSATGEYVASPASMHLEKYHQRMLQDGTLKHAFYDGLAESFEGFAKVALSPIITFFLIYDREMEVKFPVGHIHMSNFNGYCAMLHFNVLRAHHARALQIGEEVLEIVRSLKRGDGSPLVTTLLGLTPKTNRAARALVTSLGFEPIAVLDKACFLKYRQRFVDGILSKAVYKWAEKAAVAVQ